MAGRGFKHAYRQFKPSTVLIPASALSSLLGCSHEKLKPREITFDIPCKEYTEAECRALEQEMKESA